MMICIALQHFCIYKGKTENSNKTRKIVKK